jgi:uncharacterized protein YehS (DUF1456 family)
MTYNDVLRKLRYALNIPDTVMIEIFKHAGKKVELSVLKDLLKKEDEDGFVECTAKILGAFLDGLIILKRGKKETGQTPVDLPDPALNNNAILRKIRIALELKEDDMLGILKLAGTHLSGSELAAFFRKQGHKNYRECGDQVLRNFLKGLAIRCRERSEGS